MGRSQRSPAQSTESGPEYAPEFKAYMVTRCNDKEQENSRISRVDFGEPLVTLRTLGADALPAGCLPAEALPSFTGACGGGGRGGASGVVRRPEPRTGIERRGEEGAALWAAQSGAAGAARVPGERHGGMRGT